LKKLILSTEMPPSGPFLAVGIACEDVFLKVPTFPREDSKSRVKGISRARGGNCATSLVVMSMLGSKNLHFMGSVPDREAENARVIYKDFDENGICTKHAQVTKGVPASTSYILTAEDSGSRTIIHHRRSPVLRFDHFWDQKSLLQDVKWIHFEARNLENVGRMIEAIRRSRPDIFLSLELEKPEVRAEHLVRFCDLVFVSRAYARADGFIGKPVEYIEHFWENHAPKNGESGPSTIVLPWGAKGAYGQELGRPVQFAESFPPKRIVNSSGAGDTFIGAFCHRSRQQKDLHSCLRFACAAAGTKIGLESLSDLRGVDLEKKLRARL